MLYDHECWWTNHRASEMTLTKEGLSGFGICRVALEHAAVSLGGRLATVQSAEDDDTLDITLGPYRGTIHDECMPWFDSPDRDLLEAIVRGVLWQQAVYLGMDNFPSDAREYLMQTLIVGTTVHIRSEPARARIAVRLHTADASWIRRRAASIRYFNAR
jgi:hypothetical protein